MKLVLWGLLGIGLVSLSGCWNKEFNEPGRLEVEKQKTDVILSASFAKTWAAAQQVMAKFPVLKADQDKRSNRAYIVTDWIDGKSDVLYHGFERNRVPYEIRYKLYIYLVGDVRGGRTRVSIKNTEQYSDDVITAGVDVQGGLYTWIKTDSSTLKESRIIQEINKLASDPKFRSAR